MQIVKPPKYIIPIDFGSKGPKFIHLNSILHENDIMNRLLESLREVEIASSVYGFSDTIRNNILNYKNAGNNINTNNIKTYGTGIISCNCTNNKCLNHHHGTL